MSLAILVMVGGGGESQAERLLTQAQQAAARDLLDRLQNQPTGALFISAPTFDWLPASFPARRLPDDPARPFHFGQILADLIQGESLERLLYFGGASAPLLDETLAEMLLGLIGTAGHPDSSIPARMAVTNNPHSSDWLAFTDAQTAAPLLRQQERDNSLAWVLKQNGWQVRSLAGIRPSVNFDLDTPSDLAILRQHPYCPPHLSQILSTPILDSIPVEAVLNILGREGSQVALIGRVSPTAWIALNKVSQCWVRVYAEERGMVASRREQRGEVRSLLAELLRLKGPSDFFAYLATLCEAAIVDSRVLLADGGRFFSRADRFAADLYQVAEIQDPWLREFTAAAQAAPIPILLGGHGLVAGGLHVLSEILAWR
jgi:hypothetical protein